MTCKNILSVLLSAAIASSIVSCGDDKEIIEEKPVVTEPEETPAEVVNHDGLIHIASTSDYTDENHYFMLDWDEPDSIIFSSERIFDPRYPVQATITANQELRLKAFSPRRIIGMKIWAGIKGYPEKFLLAQFDTIPPFLEFNEKLPFVDKDCEYKTASGKKILILENPHISGADLQLELECEDSYYKKFSEIKTTWTVSFSKFQYDTNAYWRYPIKTGHCREAIAMTINSAYMFSSEEYKQKMEEYNGQFYSNGSGYGVNEKNGPLITDNSILVTQALYHSGGITWGHVNGVGGLGGGTVLGLTDDPFVSHYADDRGQCVAWFHEFGHGMGYGDSNNTVISNDSSSDVISWRKVCQSLYVQMCMDKKLPIYSRRFMHSRRYYNFYSSNGSNGESWRNAAASSIYVIDDPELDELDGGDR
jgi:hypothetical protein